MLFADDAAVVAHSQEHLQTLMNRFTQACQDFNLTISLSETKTMGQGTENLPSITINNYTLEAVNTFTYFGSTFTNNLSLNASEKLPLPLGSSQREYGTTGSSLSIRRCRCTEPASSAHFCMAAKPGPYNLTKSGGKTASTFAA